MRNLLGRVPLLVWFLIPTFIVMGFGVWFLGRGGSSSKQNPDAPLAVSHPVAGTVEYPIVSRTHIDEGTYGSGYNSNPPASGPHWASPAQKGIYDKSESDERYIHDLEHGYIWITYRPTVADSQSSTSSAGLKPGLDQESVDKLKAIVKADDWKIVMTPRDRDDSKIALVAWGRVLNMDSFDEKKVKDFISTYRNRAPERTQD